MMNNIKCLLTCTFFCLIFSLNAQNPIEKLDAYSFSITQGKDTIQFIKAGKDLETPKPTIIFCQGSLPIPLIIQFEDGERIITGINNFDYKKISEKYNIVIISMPFTPLAANESDLNSQYAYVTDKSNEHSYCRQYLDANYLEKYVERGNAVIKFLLKQKWVDKNQMIVVGHSQGTRVATKIAVENKNITALGYLSGNPLGRVNQFVQEKRLLAQKGRITQEKAQEEINKIYEWWEWVNQHADEPSQRGEDSPRTIISFSKPVIEDLSNLKIPIFIAYGTEDIVSFYCDLLPIDFIRAGKSNYKLKPYLGLEHNYMELDSSGNLISEKCYWEQVMNDFIYWLEEKNN